MRKLDRFIALGKRFSQTPFGSKFMVPFNPLKDWTLRQLDRGLRYDYETFEIMRRCLQSDSNCIDVGAYIGSILSRMLRYAPQGTHLAFEPLPSEFSGLQRKFGTDPRVRLFNLALSDSAGTADFHRVAVEPAYSGLRPQRYPPHLKQTDLIQVQTQILDSLVPRSLKIDLIKVDVEGGELGVLQGGRQMLERDRPLVIFEHQLGAAKYYGTTPELIWSLLHDQCGLEISLMERFLNRKASFRKDQFCERHYQELDIYFLAYPKHVWPH